jgi:PHD finger-like domain-containing protein 5A
MVRPSTLARVCDGCCSVREERCVPCGARGAVADAYYCKECVQLEKDRDRCPAVANASTARGDSFYLTRKKHGIR